MKTYVLMQHPVDMTGIYPDGYLEYWGEIYLANPIILGRVVNLLRTPSHENLRTHAAPGGHDRHLPGRIPGVLGRDLPRQPDHPRPRRAVRNFSHGPDRDPARGGHGLVRGRAWPARAPARRAPAPGRGRARRAAAPGPGRGDRRARAQGRARVRRRLDRAAAPSRLAAQRQTHATHGGLR